MIMEIVKIRSTAFFAHSISGHLKILLFAVLLHHILILLVVFQTNIVVLMEVGWSKLKFRAIVQVLVPTKVV